MPESFIIWQPGSAVQFYLLAGGKRSITRFSTQQARKKQGDVETKKEGVKKQSFMQKQPLESFMATHGPLSFYSMLFPLLLHLSSLLLHFLMSFRCSSTVLIII